MQRPIARMQPSRAASQRSSPAPRARLGSEQRLLEVALTRTECGVASTAQRFSRRFALGGYSATASHCGACRWRAKRRQDGVG